VVELIDWYAAAGWWKYYSDFEVGLPGGGPTTGDAGAAGAALVIYLIIAWRILHLVTWGRHCPDLPCEVGVRPEEWQAAWIVAQPSSSTGRPARLNDMVRLIARLRWISRAQT